MKLVIATIAMIFLAQNAHAACKYNLVEESHKVNWTGFKYTEKTGVSGTFSQVNIKSKEADSLQGLLKSIEFEVDTNSVDSGNIARDMTLMKTVFAFLSIPQTIKGSITAANDKELAVKMSFNKIMDAKFSYTAKDGLITADGVINLTRNGLLRSYDAVKEACKVLHTGEDGVSKTWPDVELKLSVNYEEKCTKGIIESIKDWFGSK